MIMALVEGTITHVVAVATMTKQAWDNLNTSFANKSQTRIYGLRGMSTTLVKENKSVIDYLGEVKAIADDKAGFKLS